jgi:lysophospholipase L1-like esterase
VNRFLARFRRLAPAVRLALESALVIASCLVGVVAMELVARVLLPARASARESGTYTFAHDEALGWAHRPSERGRLTHVDFSVDVAINAQGMRDSEYPTERTGKKRLLVLGDSYAWGFGVEHGERFSEIIEGRHPDWEVINASEIGYGTDQEFISLQQHAPVLKPDLVLLLFCVNDFVNNLKSEEYLHFKPVFRVEGGQLRQENVPVPPATLRQRLQRFLVGRTVLGQRLYRYVAARFGSVGDDPPVNDAGFWAQAADVTERLISRMNGTSKANGSRFVLVSVPMGEGRSVLQDVANREGIPYLPLDTAFGMTEDPVSFPHDDHWNAHGHQIAADAIDAFLGALGM